MEPNIKINTWSFNMIFRRFKCQDRAKLVEIQVALLGHGRLFWSLRLSAIALQIDELVVIHAAQQMHGARSYDLVT